MSAPRRPVLLYDATCRFCRFSARAVSRVDRRKRLALLPLQDTEADALLAGVRETERLESWRLVRPHGAPLSHLGVRGRVPDAVYRALAERRGLLGRLVPDGPAPRRYP